MLKRFKQVISHPLFIVSFAYLACVALISPWGNFAVNDDWDFLLHVKYFSSGSYIKNSLIDASFILQGFLGAAWTRLFGLSFGSLRMLTVCMTLLLFIGVYKLLKEMRISNFLIFLSLLCIAFNPLIFSSSLSFMTEIYFLTFMVWHVVFMLKFIRTDSRKILLVSLIIGALSILIRQFGFVLLFSDLIILLLKKARPDRRLLYILLTLTLYGLMAYITYSWPQYQTAKITNEQKLIRLFLRSSEYQTRLEDLWLILPYIGLFLSPLILGFAREASKKVIAACSLGGLILGSVLYKIDIFAMGNVFYIEGLYIKTDFVNNLSLFDNSLFKIILSVYLGFSIFMLTYLLIKKLRPAPNYQILYLSIMCLGMYLVAAVSKEYYDRYFINFFVLTIFLVAHAVNGIRPSRYPTAAAFCLAFICVLLNLDFLISTQLKWQQADQLKALTGYKKEIFVSGNYSKFLYVSSQKDYSKLTSNLPRGLSYRCFVGKYTTDSNFILLSILKKLDTSRTFNSLLLNPSLHKSDKTRNFRAAEDNLSELMLKQEYVSPLYNLVGKKVYVGSFCPKDIVI